MGLFCCCCFLAFFFSNFSTFSKIVFRRSSSLSESRRASSIAFSNCTLDGEGGRLALLIPAPVNGICPTLEPVRLLSSGSRLWPMGLSVKKGNALASKNRLSDTHTRRAHYVLSTSEGKSRMCCGILLPQRNWASSFEKVLQLCPNKS